MIEDNPAIDRAALRSLLASRWRIRDAPGFLPVGGGSWSYRAGDRFVNVRHADDRRAPYDEPRDVARSFAVAAALRDRCGLHFLLAPTPAVDGASSARLDEFVVVVTPFVDGDVRVWSGFERHELEQAVEWVSLIHASTAAVVDVPIDTRPFELGFVAALRDAVSHALAGATSYGERLLALVAQYRDALLESIAAYERLVHALRARRQELVVTHGEPNPQNILEEPDGTRWLIDLGEIALGPRELDLHVLWRAARPKDRDLVPALDPDLHRYCEDRFNLSEITEYLDHLTRRPAADVVRGEEWDWHREPEPTWANEDERAWGLLRYFLGTLTA